MSPLISVVIPFYNSQNSLRDCLNAVFKSTYKNYEVIAVSDGTKDMSLKTANTFPCRVISLQKNHGSGHASNTGAKIAKGKISKFLNDNSLLNQIWIMDPKKKVSDVLKENSLRKEIKILDFAKYKVGEGV